MRMASDATFTNAYMYRPLCIHTYFPVFAYKAIKVINLWMCQKSTVLYMRLKYMYIQ